MLGSQDVRWREVQMRSLQLLAIGALLAGAARALAAPSEAVAPADRPTEPPAEDRGWSLSVGTGAGSFFEFADGLAGIGPSGYDRRSRDRFQVNLRVDRELNRRFRAGLAYMVLGWSEAYSSGGTSAGAIDQLAQVLMLDVTVRWHRSAHVETYSGLAAGYGRWHAEGTVAGTPYADTQSGPAFQLRYFGVSAGNDRLRVFADLGIGFEGLVVVGATLRL
jgi:hypothetical protein